MAKLEDLLPQYHLLSDSERVELVRNYRKRRAEDLASRSESKLRPTRKSKSLSEEEKVLMKLLGLSAKQLLCLKSIEPTEPEEDEEDDEGGNF